MGFKTKEQLREIQESGVTTCDVHDFICDTKDTETIKKHFEELEHTISGSAICQRCKKVRVEFKGLPKPPMGSDPGAFCEDCKKALVAEFTRGKK